MASFSSPQYFLSLLLLVSIFFIVINGGNSESWYSNTKPTQKKVEQETHLHFFFHDTRSGKHPSAIQIAGPAGFGSLLVQDDPLTVGIEPTSKVIGSSQGTYISADQHETAYLMCLIFVFTEGKYNESTVSVLSRNPIITHPVREFPIVGGTGLFRFARGYATLKTVWRNAELRDAIVEYNMTIIHY